jgi:hypothetical protein
MMENDKFKSGDNTQKKEADDLHQPKRVRDDRPGWGDKKLDGPNRPAE